MGHVEIIICHLSPQLLARRWPVDLRELEGLHEGDT